MLTEAVRNAAGGLLLLSGEAGIGKSRLAEHALAIAREQGLTVLRGQAHALHSGLAYAPIVEAVRPHVARLGDHTGLEHLGRMLADPRLPAPRPGGDPALERTRMFEAVAALATRLAPAVLFIDDLHWADQGTVELVHYIGRNAQGVLVLGAYRPSEAGSALADLAVAVRRDNGVLPVEPLSDEAVAELTETLLGHTPDPEFAATVTQRAKGVPLFVTALVHEGFHENGDLPAIVRDVVLARLHQLDDAERRVLEVVAVAGESASDAVLRLVTEIRTALRSLITGGLVTEYTAGRQVRYRVAHPLYAEVVYAELTINERRTLHAALVKAIEQTDPGDVLALAPHYQAAGTLTVPARAVEVMAEAGWRALAMSAPEEAVRYLGAAAELADPGRVPALLDGLGRAHQSLGRYDEALAAWREGLQSAARNGMMDDAGGLQLRMLRLEAERTDSKAANDRLHDLAQRLSVTSHEAAFRYFEFTLRHSAQAETSEAAAMLAAFAGDGQPAESQSIGHLGRGFQLLLELRHHEAVRVMETAVEHGRKFEGEYPFYARFTRLLLSYARALTGDARGCLRDITASMATPTLVETPALRCFELYGLAFATYLSGDIRTALGHIDAGVTTAVDARLPRSVGRNMGLRAFLLAELGRLGEARSALAEARQAYLAPDMSLTSIIGFADAALRFHTGGPSTSDMWDPYATFADPLSGTVRPLFTGLTALANGDHDLVSGLIPVLRSESPHHGLALAFADRLEGLLTNDPSLVLAAATQLDTIGTPLLARQTRLEWAELTGDRDTLPDAIAEFDKVGAAPWADRARQHARSLGLRVASARSSGVLTNRETQVVRLLGDGLSNADIAARLYLSERTVETHLRNAYSKLSMSSRVALARWASENLP